MICLTSDSLVLLQWRHAAPNHQTFNKTVRMVSRTDLTLQCSYLFSKHRVKPMLTVSHYEPRGLLKMTISWCADDATLPVEPFFWCTRERFYMNRVRSLLSMRAMWLGYSVETRPNSRALGTVDSVRIIGLIKKWRLYYLLLVTVSLYCKNEITSVAFQAKQIVINSNCKLSLLT